MSSNTCLFVSSALLAGYVLSVADDAYKPRKTSFFVELYAFNVAVAAEVYMLADIGTRLGLQF